MADSIHRRPSYFSGCMSPSCFPAHEEYRRVHVGRHVKSHGGRKLRKLFRKIVSESKCIYASPSRRVNFQYDTVSYSQNFDEGCHRDDQCGRIQHVSDRDFRWQ